MGMTNNGNGRQWGMTDNGEYQTMQTDRQLGMTDNME